MQPPRVWIADDHLLFRDAMRLVLGTQPYLTVVGEAATGAERNGSLRALHLRTLDKGLLSLMLRQ